MLPFVGVDGEGGDIADEYGFTHHQYTMLRVGDDYVTDAYLPFLASLPKKRIYVAYFFDYDVTMMCRDLPEEDIRMLVSGQPTLHRGLTLGYRPHKEFTVQRGRSVTTINDVGSFFQCRFVTALERWNIGTSEQRAIIADGKEERQHFGELAQQTIDYNGMECRLLVELMEKFRRTCEAIGYLPRRWQGPGQLAKAMFKAHHIPLSKDLPEPPPGVWAMAQAAYYGGRFETSAVGPVKGPIEGWDINSAYPYACTLLPCLRHVDWRPAKSLSSHGMYRVSFDHRKGQMWFGLPIRTSDGAIRFPRAGSGWYWGVELKSAIKLGAQLTIHDGWEYSVECDCQPFNFMHRLYSVRKGVGKSEAGIAIKLGMNSAYGITAQSIGKAPYANPVWAGLITAITRARLNGAIAQDPDAVYMVATDGLYARPGLQLEESADLGGWERTIYPDGMHIVQPGVYFVGHKQGCPQDDTCRCVPKTRGVPLTVIRRHEDALRLAWSGSMADGYEVPLRQFIGLRLGAHRSSWGTIGEWLSSSKRIAYDWSTKRRPDVTRRGIEAIRTVPYTGDAHVWTTPYSRAIGGNVLRGLDKLELADQPDWADLLSDSL